MHSLFQALPKPFARHWRFWTNGSLLRKCLQQAMAMLHLGSWRVQAILFLGFFSYPNKLKMASQCHHHFFGIGNAVTTTPQSNKSLGLIKSRLATFLGPRCNIACSKHCQSRPQGLLWQHWHFQGSGDDIVMPLSVCWDMKRVQEIILLGLIKSRLATFLGPRCNIACSKHWRSKILSLYILSVGEIEILTTINSDIESTKYSRRG